MKLPNDLIKATDYSKAKNREIHEFEYRDKKYIHKYVLGGEHELTPQEIIDCLNAISTIDCDLQTAYAFIQSQKDKIADLEAKLAKSEEFTQGYREECAKIQSENVNLKQQLAESEETIEKLKDLSVKYYCAAFNYKEKLDKDKISFAVEQLEKVKEFNIQQVFSSKPLDNFIDNQIKQLKEGK